jgi:hypothetical protein
MTLQDLLREATQLSLKEQVQLATQLLQLVDQQIAIASESKVSKPIDPASAKNLDSEEGSIGYLLAHPIAVKGFQPLSRDEIYDRRT